ncbi:hypothetical protein JQN58_27720 [Aneurinibacillus sp. BA2021]|nr:hypothetical protein [Aneurinibacillus sp. BA2021]
MTALRDLFPDGPRSDHRADVVLDDTHTRWRLREMIGEPRRSEPARAPLADTRELARMAEAAARTAVPFTAESPRSAREPRLQRRRPDLLTTAAAALAVLAVAAAATVGGIQAATASPAASALESLQADEASIQNAHQALTSARDTLVADIGTQTAEATALRTAIVDTATVPDPASSSDDDVIAVADPALEEAAVAALDGYLAALAAVTVPELPAEYRRAEIDENSLVDVGQAIDDAQGDLDALDQATAEMRTIRTAFDALRPAATPAVTAYLASSVPAAAEATADRQRAEESFRTAVTDAAAQVAASDPWTPGGQAALVAYRDAFAALLDDQFRAEVEQERADTQRRQGGQSGGQQDQPSDGSTPPPPTDPGTGGDTPPGDGTDDPVG